MQPSKIESPLTRVADARTWRVSCAMAHALLCRGDGHHRVEEHEPWLEALIRTAAELMHSHGYGRPLGGADPEWERIVIEIAHQPSSSEDGGVATRSGRVHLSRIPRGC